MTQENQRIAQLENPTDVMVYCAKARSEDGFSDTRSIYQDTIHETGLHASYTKCQSDRSHPHDYSQNLQNRHETWAVGMRNAQKIMKRKTQTCIGI